MIPKPIKPVAEIRTTTLNVERRWARLRNSRDNSDRNPVPARAMVASCLALAVCVELVVTLTTNVPVPPDARFKLLGVIVHVA